MKQAMIFAAGLGTRLKPLTDTMPKALVTVGGQPLLWHVVQKLKVAGFERIVVNVHHFAEQIVDYLQTNGNFGLDIRVSDETSGLLETGGGVKKALPLFDPSSPVLIHNVDILSNLDFSSPLFTLHSSSKDTDALLVVSSRQTKRYLLFDNGNRLQGWTNVETGEVRGIESSQFSVLSPQLRRLAFSGIHVLSPRVFPLFLKMPDRFSIIDFYLKYCRQCVFIGQEQRDLRLMDVGKADTLAEADAFLQSII